MPATALQFPVRQPAPKDRRTFKDERQLAALKAPATGSIEVADAKVKGLSVRITAANHRSFSFRYSNPQQLMKRIVIGDVRDFKLEAARAKVSAFRVILKEGKDPAHVREETRTAVTFGALAEQWFAEKAIHLKRKGKRERQMYDADLAHWVTRPAADITRAELVDTLNTKSNRGKLVAANHLRALISRIYRFAIQSGRIPVTANPVPGTVKHKEERRARYLTLDEIREVWAACDHLSLHQRVWFRLRLVTGQRAADLIQMRWADLDAPKKGFWSLPGEFTKNGLPHTVYLSSLAQELLAQLPRRVEDGPFDPVWVFPACGNGNAKDNVVRNDAGFDVMGDYPKIGRRLAQPSRMQSVKEREAKVPAASQKRDKRGWKTRVKADFTGHDLRRTMTTIAISGGVDEELLGRILNHKKKSGNVTGSVYNHHGYNPEKKAIMSFWDTQLRVILAGGDDDAVEAIARFSMDKPSAVQAELQAQLAAMRALLTPKQLAALASA